MQEVYQTVDEAAGFELDPDMAKMYEQMLFGVDRVAADKELESIWEDPEEIAAREQRAKDKSKQQVEEAELKFKLGMAAGDVTAEPSVRGEKAGFVPGAVSMKERIEAARAERFAKKDTVVKEAVFDTAKQRVAAQNKKNVALKEAETTVDEDLRMIVDLMEDTTRPLRGKRAKGKRTHYTTAGGKVRLGGKFASIPPEVFYQAAISNPITDARTVGKGKVEVTYADKTKEIRDVRDKEVRRFYDSLESDSDEPIDPASITDAEVQVIKAAAEKKVRLHAKASASRKHVKKLKLKPLVEDEPEFGLAKDFYDSSMSEFGLTDQMRERVKVGARALAESGGKGSVRQLLMAAGMEETIDKTFHNIVARKPTMVDKRVWENMKKVADQVIAKGSQAGKDLRAMRHYKWYREMMECADKLGTMFNQEQLQILYSTDINNADSVAATYNQLVTNKGSAKWLRWFFYTGLLSGLTSLRNIAGNIVMSSYETAHRFGSATVDTGQSILTGKQREVFFGEGFEMLTNQLTSLFDGSLWMDVGRVLGNTSSKKENLTKIDEEMAGASQMIDDWFDKHFGKVLGGAANFPLRSLKAFDVFFKGVAGNGMRAALDYKEDQIFNRYGQAGLEKYKAEFVAREDKMPSRLTKDQEKMFAQSGAYHKDAYSRARANAIARYEEHATFQDELGPGMQGLVSARSSIPGVGRILVPFMHTQVNIFKRGLELTPGVGAAMHFAGMDQLTLQEMITKQLEGIGVTLAVMSMVNSGRLTGGPPEDPAQRELDQKLGKQYYSVKIGNTWLNYQYIEPLGFPVGMMVDLIQKWQDPDTKEKADSNYKLFLTMVAEAKDYIVDNSFVSSLADTMSRGEYGITGAIKTTASGMIPYSAFWRMTHKQYLAKSQGQIPVMQQDTFMGMFGESLPPYVGDLLVESGTVKPPTQKIDAFGQPIYRKSTFLNEWCPFKLQTSTPDPVEDELALLGKYPKSPDDKITINGVSHTVPPELYGPFVIEYGTASRKAIERTISLPFYRTQQDVEKKKKMVSRAIEQSTRIINNRLTIKMRRFLRDQSKGSL
jgi:hypothetical protein